MDEIDIKIMEKGLPGTSESDMPRVEKSADSGWKDPDPRWDIREDLQEDFFDEPIGPASGRQVGGDHYKEYEIQPGEYCQINRLPYMESNAVKYITRHGKKHNGREDIEKAIHCLELVLEWDYDE